jgi:hypothetical protein
MDFGRDYGTRHIFCADCLALLEIGQGLVEDPAFAAEWKQMLKKSDLGDGFGVDRLMMRDTRRAKRLYAALEWEPLLGLTVC